MMSFSFPLADFSTMILIVILFIYEVRIMKKKIEGILITSQVNFLKNIDHFCAEVKEV